MMERKDLRGIDRLLARQTMRVWPAVRKPAVLSTRQGEFYTLLDISIYDELFRICSFRVKFLTSDKKNIYIQIDLFKLNKRIISFI